MWGGGSAVRRAVETAKRLECVVRNWDYVYGDVEMLYPQFVEVGSCALWLSWVDCPSVSRGSNPPIV